MKSIFIILLTISCTINIFAEQESFTKEQYFIDSAQMLTECLYVIQKTGRFDIAEKQILSNAKIGKIPPELKNISKRIIDTCQQGRILLQSEKAINEEFEAELTGIGIKAGSRLGTALAMEDPVSAIWAVYEGASAFSRATAKNDQRISAVLQQLDYRIKSDMYDLRNCITENAEKYDVDATRIISFEVLEELERLLPKFSKNPDSILAFMNRYPYYTKLQYYAIKHGASNLVNIFDTLISSKNSILDIDQDRLNACADIGNRIIWNLIKNGTQMKQEDRLDYLNGLIFATRYGLENGGHSCSVFYFMRGVANSFALYYDLKPMSGDNIWNDLLYEEKLDQGEYMNYQSIWCASLLACPAIDLNSSKEESLITYLKAALKVWKPAYIMNNSPFCRSETAQAVYKDLLKVKFECDIIWGIFNDDIILKNNSPFPLTDVVLSVTLSKKSHDLPISTDQERSDNVGQQFALRRGHNLSIFANQERYPIARMKPHEPSVIFEKDLRCSYIGAYDMYKWTNIMSIEGGNDSTISIKAHIECEESSIENSIPSFVGNKLYIEDISPESMFNTGCKYVEKQDFAEAIKWFKKSAIKDYAPAQNELGLMYLNGLGVEKDYSQAFSWCSKAANQGLNLAQLNLALMYEEGFGCKANPSKALDLYRESAKRGCSEAQHKLGVICLYGQCDVEKIIMRQFNGSRRLQKNILNHNSF